MPDPESIAPLIAVVDFHHARSVPWCQGETPYTDNFLGDQRSSSGWVRQRAQTQQRTMTGLCYRLWPFQTEPIREAQRSGVRAALLTSKKIIRRLLLLYFTAKCYQYAPGDDSLRYILHKTARCKQTQAQIGGHHKIYRPKGGRRPYQ